MKTKEVMETVTKGQAIEFVNKLNSIYPSQFNYSQFNTAVAFALKTATGREISVNGTLAQGLCTAMEKKAKINLF